MTIRETSNFGEPHSRFDASAAEETLRELEEQYARGDIETRAYLIKKRSLVKLFLKATTSPKRRYREENYDGD